jgi:hypothetical protein
MHPAAAAHALYTHLGSVHPFFQQEIAVRLVCARLNEAIGQVFRSVYTVYTPASGGARYFESQWIRERVCCRPSCVDALHLTKPWDRGSIRQQRLAHKPFVGSIRRRCRAECVKAKGGGYGSNRAHWGISAKRHDAIHSFLSRYFDNRVGSQYIRHMRGATQAQANSLGIVIQDHTANSQRTRLVNRR